MASQENDAPELIRQDWELAAEILGYPNYSRARIEGHMRPRLRAWAARVAAHRVVSA